MNRQLMLLMIAWFALANGSREGNSQDFQQRRDSGQSPRNAAPPNERDRPRPPAGRPGPWDQDILVYRTARNGTSEKLATFFRAGVSTVARLRDDRLIVAHQHFPEDNTADFDKVAVRFSSDEGRTWSGPEVIRLTGFPEGMRLPFDPTLVPLPDGRVRMYFTSLKQWRPNEDRPEIYSATSSNGLDFAFEPGVRFGIAGRPVIDCAVVRHGDTFHLFAPDNGTVGQPGAPTGERAPDGVGYHATSSDGLTFERQRDVRIEGRRHWLGNALSDGESIRFIGTGGPGGMWMARSADGQSWTLDREFSPVPGADPGAVRLKDGSWLVTVTGPPRVGTPSDRLRRPPPRSPPENKP